MKLWAKKTGTGLTRHRVYTSDMVGRWGIVTDRAVGLACLVLGVVISVGVLRHDPVLAGITVAVAFGYTWLIW